MMVYTTAYLYTAQNNRVGQRSYVMQNRGGNYWVDVPGQEEGSISQFEH